MSTNQTKAKKIKAQTPYSSSKGLVAASRVVTILISLTIVYPIIFIILVSFKNNQEFYSNIWGLPSLWRWSNYSYAGFREKSAGTPQQLCGNHRGGLRFSLLSALAGYALSKMFIPKAELVLSILMCFNFIPGVAIYIPLYVQMIGMGLSKTLWMLILPYLGLANSFQRLYFQKVFRFYSLRAFGGRQGRRQHRTKHFFESDYPPGTSRHRHRTGV